MTEKRRNIPSTTRLLAFSAACRHGNFTHAGDELHITQAAVSRQVRELEEELGVSLFTRRSRDVVPTEAARLLIEDINPALASIAQSVKRIKRLPRENHLLTICTDHGLAGHYLLPMVDRFETQFPEYSVRLISSNAMLDTISEHYDLAVSYDLKAPNHFRAQTIEEDEIFPVAATGLIGNEIFSDIDALAQYPLLELAASRHHLVHWPEFLADHGYQKTVNPKVIYDSYAVALDAAINGQGLLFGWRVLVERYLKSGVLKRLGNWSIPVHSGVQLFTPELTHQTEVTKAFIAWLLNEKPQLSQ